MILPIEKNYYISHHCVFKSSSTTTRLRVVFYGSAQTTSGVSLNDGLMVGPKTQQDLFSILMCFRMYPLVFSADIAKMYSQVQLDAEDKDYLQLFCKEPNPTDIKTFRITRVTYRITSSAFHSVHPLPFFIGRFYGQKCTPRNHDRHVRRRPVDRSTRSGKCNKTAGLNYSSCFRGRVWDSQMDFK